jgi:hypothetical protein
MTLFLWLDLSGYAGYWPRYISGKCVSLVSVMIWFVLSRQEIYIAAYLDSGSVFIITGILGIMLAGDLLSAAAGFLAVRKLRIIAGRAGDVGRAGADNAAAVKDGGE